MSGGSNSPDIREKIVEFITKHGSATYKELVNYCGKVRSMIHDNCTILENKDVIERHYHNNGRRGRPRVFFKLTSKENDENE